MPDAVSKKRRAETDKTMFIRIRNGKVYGPVPITELTGWAESGNIMPGDEISADGERWQFAVSLPDLRMNVMLERGDGSFQGPFNEKAVEPLIKNGSIPSDAKRIPFENLAPPAPPPPAPKIDRQRMDAIEAEIRADMQAEMEERIGEAAQQARDAIAGREREIETLREELALSETQKEALKKETEAQLATQNSAIAGLEKNAAELKTQAAEKEQQNAALKKEFADFLTVHSELIEFANSRDNEFTAKIEAQETQLAEMRAADYNTLSQRLKRAEAALADAEREFASAHMKWQTANNALQSRVKELERGAGSLFGN